MIIGFNYFKPKIKFAKNLSDFAQIIYKFKYRAIELTYIHEEINKQEIKDASLILNKFDFLSVHGSEEKSVKKFLRELKLINKYLKVNIVVFHSEKLKEILESKLNYCAIENQGDYADIKNFSMLMGNNSLPVVIDLAHWWGKNPKISDWKIPLDLTERISHFHVSGVRKNNLHVSLNKRGYEILKFAQRFDKPIILEAIPKTINELKKTFKSS